MVESKYWVWTARETSELRTETIEAPGPDDVLIKTRFSGVSPGTEMALYTMAHVGFKDPDNHYAEYPHRGGYLNVGVVAEAGANARGKCPPGTWVFSAATHCQYQIATPQDSGWGGCRVLPEALCGPEAVYLGLAKVGYTAPFLAPAALGERVAVLGGGLVGNLAAQLYNASGAKVLIVERDGFRREIAVGCGLEAVSSLEEVEGHFGAAPELVVEATGVPDLVVEAFKMVAQGGRVVILSSPRGEAPVNFYSQIHAKLVTVIGAHAKAVTNSSAATRLMIDLVAAGKLALKGLVTHVESWRKAPEVWDAYARGPGKRLGTVFDWQD